MQNSASRVVLASVCMLFLASQQAHAVLRSYSGKIVNLVTGLGGEGIYIYLDMAQGPITLTPTCNGSVQRFFVPIGFSMYKDIYATLLLAAAQGRPVVITYDDGICPNSSVQGYGFTVGF